MPRLRLPKLTAAKQIARQLTNQIAEDDTFLHEMKAQFVIEVGTNIAQATLFPQLAPDASQVEVNSFFA